MGVNIKQRLSLTVLLCLASQLLMGAITAEYVPAPALYFDTGNTISTPNTP